jgi:uncharacterized protein DUF397
MNWQKASMSTSEGTNCVEVGRILGERRIATRDSKDPDGPQLRFTTDSWREFLDEIKRS